MQLINIPGVGNVNFPEGMSQADIVSAIERDVLPGIKKEVAPEVTTPPLPSPETESFSTLRQVADVPLQASKGVVSGVRMVADAFGAGSDIGKSLKGTEDYIANLMSAQSKQDSQTITRILKEAEDKGVLEQVRAGVRAFSTAPVDFLSNALGTAAPAIAATLAASVLGPAAAVATGITTGLTMGAGTVKGSIYDAVKDELGKTNMPADQIEARAQLAQNYNGQNLDMILIGSAIGSIGATTGIEPAIARQITKSILTKTAVKEELKKATEEQLKNTAARGVFKQTIRTGGVESGTEFAQASQEKLAENIALQREGYDVPTMRGVVAQGTLEGLAGLGLGSVTGARESLQAKNIIAQKDFLESEKTRIEEERLAKESERTTAPQKDINELLTAAIDGTQKTTKEETFDVISDDEKTKQITELEAKINERQTKIDTNTHPNMPAAIIAQARDNKLLASLRGSTPTPPTTPTLDAELEVLKAQAVTPSATPEQAAAPEAVTKEDTKPEYIKQAESLIAAVDSGGVPLSTAKINAIAREFGMEVSKRAKPAETIERIREALIRSSASLGEQDAIQQTDVGTGGDGTELSGRPPAVDAAAGVARDGRPRVAGDQGAELTPQDGAGSEQLALKQKTQSALEQQAIEAETAPDLSYAAMAKKAGVMPKAKGKKAPATVPGDYLSSKTFYGDKSPVEIINERIADPDNKLDTDPINIGINNAGHETAFDAYDTVDIRTGVMPELKDIAKKRNKGQQVKRQQMRQELSGKVDSETGKKYTNRRITSLVSNIPVYEAGAPLDFLTEDELVDIYRKYANKRGFIKGEATTRGAQQQNRTQFVEGLEELQKAKVQVIAQRSFADEVVSNARRKTQTTAADKRKARADKLSKTADELSQEQKTIIKEDITIREEAAQKVVEKEAAEEKQLTQELKEFNKAAEKVLPKKQAPKEKPAPSKSKLVTKLESAIVDNDVDAALDVIGTDRINESSTRTIAQSFLKLVKNFGGVTIQFNDLPEGEDGLFDPATNTIALKGKDGVYTGARPIDQTVMHEVGHYLTDHVFDNREAYLKSIKDPAKRKEVQNALNRLDNNYRFVKGKLGDKFNIPTMKEFIAEIFSNIKFEEAVANLDPYKTSERIGGFTGPRKQFRKFEGGMLQTIVRNIANALGFSSDLEGVTFKEILDDVFKIVSLPTADLRGKEVSYAAQPKTPKKAPPFLEITDVYGDNPAFEVPQKMQKTGILSTVKDLASHKGIEKLFTLFQNSRRALVTLRENNILAGINQSTGPFINDILSQITLAIGRGLNYFHAEIQQPLEELQKAVVELSKTKEIIEATEKQNEARKLKGDAKITPLTYLEQVLHIYAQAFTDQERRENMFIQSSPLSNDKNIDVNGKMISIADLRELILGNPTTKKPGIYDTDLNLTAKQARDLWLLLESYIFTTDTSGKKIANPKYVVPGGSSPLGRKVVDFRSNDGNVEYNVTGFTYQETEKIIADYEKDPNKNILDKVLEATYKLNSISKELNKKSYYLSKPADNWINAYAYKRYVPLKGISASDANIIAQRSALNFSGKTLEKELNDTETKATGRFSVSNNPILQSMSEAIISTVRAGKGPSFTLAIKNSAQKSKKNPNGQGLILAEVVEHISFSDRSYDVIKNVRKENTVLHHNEDGSIDVIEIYDPKILQSIRRTYKEQNKYLELANRITSGLGQMHTRYNINFAPVNFVRDALTNAFNIGSKYGASKSFDLVANIAYQITTQNSLGKALKIAYAYKTPNFEKFKNSPDPVYRNMYEFIKRGGMVEFLEGISVKSNLDKLDKELTLSKSRVIRGVQGVNTIIDVWTNMFEIASRSAAYGLLKEQFMNVDKLDKEAASERAATETKNLANFEQVGEYGKAMGALYMFFRPAATGAVTALDSLFPALTGSLGRAVKNAPEYIQKDPKKLETFKANYKLRQSASITMVTALGGLGSLAYIMSYMMADTDDEGRNKTLTDDLGQWTRFARFHMPGYDKPFLIPWGFGFGAFAAMGAQLTAAAMGQQSFLSALKNGVTQISLDSFIPIPFSRMDVADDPVSWFVDSVSPSLFRPVIEFTMNKNGLGQSIYNDASGRRMGDAYLGGDNVPETYKITSAFLAELTEGYIDWTPNTTYFLVNSYADGVGRIIDLAVNNYYFATGGRDWDTKSNLPLVGSFIGTPPNVDTKNFIKVEKQIDEIRATTNMFKKNRPDYYYSTYLPNNPYNELIIKTYDSNITALNKLRAESKTIRSSEDTPKEKKELLNINKEQQNMVKRNLINMFEGYDIKP